MNAYVIASPRRRDARKHSLPGGSLSLIRTGFAPVGSRRLRLAHRVVTPTSLRATIMGSVRCTGGVGLAVASLPG